MKFFNNVKKIFKREQLVSEKPEKGSKKLVFDMGALPTIASLLLLFSTIGTSIFFTKNNISKSFSSKIEKSVHSDVFGKATVSLPVAGYDDPACNWINNDEFDSGTSDWSLYVQSGSSATWSVNNSSQLSGSNSALVNISSASGTDWHIQLAQSPFSMVAGTDYSIRFDAKATAPRTIAVMIQQRQSPWNTYFTQTVNLTTTSAEYGVYTFTAPATDSNVGLLFNLGASSANVYLDDVIFGEESCFAGGAATISSQISSSSDDVEEEGLDGSSPGSVYTNSTDLELVQDPQPATSGTQHIGMRFNNLNIPQGAVITDAYIVFTADTPDGGNPSNSSATTVSIAGQDIDNAPIFTTANSNVSTRTTTSASVNWSPSSWTTGATYNTPSLATIVKEIVDRPGWSSGSSLAMIVTGTNSGGRTAHSYDGVPASAPILYVTYTSGGGGGGGTVGNSTISGKVYKDNNTNAINDGGDVGESGVTVRLYEDNNQDGLVDAGDTQIQTTTTDSNGDYSFSFGSYSGVITQSSDDALEEDNNNVTINSTTVKFKDDGSTDWNGLRFNGITIPSSATITSAYLYLTSTDSRSSTPANVTIYGQDGTSTPSTFAASSGDITSRSRTTANELWSLGAWTTDTESQSPDLSSIVQEIVGDQAGLSNESIALLIEGINSKERRAYSWDNDPNFAPRLEITYTLPATQYFVMEVDPTTFVLDYEFTTDNVETAVFSTSGTDTGNDFGFYGTNSIEGTVFEDFNKNGILDGLEPGTAGIDVILYEDINNDGLVDGGDSQIQTATTNGSGGYNFGLNNTYAGSYDNRVSQGNNDAEDGANTSTRLRMGKDKDSGVRFDGITIPTGATITSAYLYYVCNSTSNKFGSINIYGEDIASPVDYGSNSDVIGRTRTTAQVGWNFGNWTVDTEYQTSDISSIVSELYGTHGPYNNDVMNFILISNGSDNLEAKSYETNGNSTEAPRLVINYIVPSSNYYVTEIDVSTLPTGYFFTTDNVETAVFSAAGNDSSNDFGFLTAEVCNDGIDNDGDGLIDCADPDCSAFDNDGDLVCDYLDLDDDNDGIPDVEEMACPSGYIALAQTFSDNTSNPGTINGLYPHEGVSVDFTYELLGTATWDSGVSNASTGGVTGDYINVQPRNTDVSTGDVAVYTFDFTQPVYNLSFKFGGFDRQDRADLVAELGGVNVPLTITDINLGNGYITGQTVVDVNGSVANAPGNSVLVTIPGSIDQLTIRTGKDDGEPTTATLQIFELSYCASRDTDLDGVVDHLDLDSDNDGIYDVEEAGHGESHTNGVVTGALGSNGLLDAVETSAESGILNYTISDSETAPDGTYDAYELDSDGDGCNDTDEEGISDTDSDGLAGVGVPAVDVNGLVTSITYATPTNNFWQNPIQVSLACDTDNDGINPTVDLDDDNDGIPDTDEGCNINIANPNEDFAVGNDHLYTAVSNNAGDAISLSNWDTDVNTGDYTLNTISDWTVSTNRVIGTAYTYTNADLTLNVIADHEDVNGGVFDGTTTGFASGTSGNALGIRPGENFGVDDDFTIRVVLDFNTPTHGVAFELNDMFDQGISANDASTQLQIFVDGARVLYTDMEEAFNNAATGTKTIHGEDGTDINYTMGNNQEFAFGVYNNSGVSNIEILYSVDGPPVVNGDSESWGFDNLTYLTLNCRDTDSDGISDYLDLDSDNDGIYDIDEAGHAATDANDDGVIDGVASLFGNNGLFDAVETSADSDVINYTIADSEAIPDGTYDAYELDSDGDGCNDTDEEGISDTDSDGLAGAGVPVVDGNGLVTSITYATPTNNFWQNSNLVSLACDTDNDGINPMVDLDDDNDGIPDIDECSDYLQLDFNNATSTTLNGSSISSIQTLVVGDIIVVEDLGTRANGVAVDAIIELVEATNGVEYDPNNGAISLSPFNPSNDDYLIFSIEIFETGTTNSIPFKGRITFKDIDSGSGQDFTEVIGFSGQNETTLGSNLQFMTYQAGGGSVGYTHVGLDPSISGDIGNWSDEVNVFDSNVDHWVTTNFGGNASITISFGVTGSIGSIPGARDLFLSEMFLLNSCDTDSDGVPDYLDLDSDNDGIFDVDEAGHAAADADNDGIIDGVPADFGTNGLFDAVETSADSDVINYAIADSETSPDGTYDAYELDSDGDGCNDTDEEGISDTDSDGLAGTGVPTVDANGLVTSITYASPTNNFWQNPLSGVCLTEVCNDGIDNDADGDIDCLDSDCTPIVTLNLVDSTECVSSTTLILSGENPSGGTYSGTGVSGGNFDASVAGVGKYEITYSYTDGNGCTNVATDSIEVTALPIVTLTLADNQECLSSTSLALSGGLPIGGTYSGTGVTANNFDASAAGVGTYTITYTYTDANGCINSATDDITVSDLSISFEKTDALCVGGAGGAIDITVTGAVGTLTYDWDNDGTGDNDDSEDLSNISSGVYNVTVTDGTTGCTATESVTIYDVENPFSALVMTGAAVSTFPTGTFVGGFYQTFPTGTEDFTFTFDHSNIPASHVIEPNWAGSIGLIYTMNDINPASNAFHSVHTRVTEYHDFNPGDIPNESAEIYHVYGRGNFALNSSGTATSHDLTFTFDFSGLTNGYLPAGTMIGFTDVDGLANGKETALLTSVLQSGTNDPWLTLLDKTDVPAQTQHGEAQYEASGQPTNSYYIDGPAVNNASIAYLTSENLTSITINVTNHTGGSIGMKIAAPIVLQTMTTLDLDLTDSVECVSSTTLALSGETPAGGVFTGLGVTGTNFDASVAGVGTHAITYTYTDVNGCSESVVDSLTVLPLPTVSLTLVDDEECVNSTVLPLSGGTPIGGTYSGTGVSGGNFNASSAGLGTHTITYTYTDTNGCLNTATNDITVIALPAVSLTLTDDQECITSTSVALGGGTPIGGTYSGAAVTGTTFDPSAAGAGVHTITYTYTDANGCENTATDNMIVHALPTVSLTFPDTEDCVLNSTFALSGGSPSGGIYSGTGVTGSNFNASAAGLGVHTITYTYTNGNGCVNTATDQITVVSGSTVSLVLGNNEECVTSSSLALSGGSPVGGTYSGAGVSGTNFNASAVGAGVHTIFYTYSDVNGCSNTATDNITVYSTPSITNISSTDPTTCGGNDGTITITASGGSGNYEYRLNGGNWQVSNIFSGLITGNYNVELRNDNGTCETNYVANPVILSDPASFTAAIILPAFECVGTAADFEAVRPGGGYSYSWDFGSGASPATATGRGSHSVTYSTDGTKTISLSVEKWGCTDIVMESYTVYALPSVSLNLPDIEECVESTTLALSGGSPVGGSFSGLGVSGNNFDASVAGVGTHTVTYTYTDANGCANTATDDITVLSSPVVGLTLGINEDCIDNSILLLSGGTPVGGTYSGTAVSGTNFDASAAGLGVHTISYTYTDGNGCVNTATDNITVFDFPNIDNVSISDATTCGGTEGSITVTASGGSGNYEYQLNSGAWQSSNTFTGLSAGNYNLSIRNDNGLCEVIYPSNPITVNDPPAILVSTAVTSNYVGEDITCVGAADGTAQATGSGGLAPYTYVWNDGQTGADLLNVSAGTYTVTATDANNCQAINTVTLNDPPPLGVSAVFTDVTCYGGFDGAIDVTAIGGVGAYTYSWNDLDPEAFWAMDGSTDDITGNNHHVRSFLGPEAYSVDAVDGGQSFDFKGGTRIWYDDDVSFLESSFTEQTITMWIKPDNLSGIQMLWDGGERTHGVGLRLDGDKLQGSVRSFLTERSAYEMTIPNDGNWHQVGFIYDNGDFTLMVDGVFGTTNNTGFSTIQMLPAPSNQCGLGGKLGEDSFGGFAWGNRRFYSGLMDNVSFHNTALRTLQLSDNFTDDGDRTGLPAGDYKVYVYDLNGCLDSVTLTLTQPDSLALTANITDVLCNGESNGAIDLVVAGGVSPYTYSWSTGATVEDISSLPIGTYTITVTDDHGCTVEDDFTITEPAVLTASASVTSYYNGYDVSCFGSADGSATATPSGGTAPFNYLWSNGQTSQTLVNVGAGTYTVTVTDDNGCTETASVTLTNAPQIIVSSSVTSNYSGEDISCFGGSNGSANANASNGVGSYSYAWSNGATGANLLNVAAGTYTVTATDNNGCTTTGTVTLQNPPQINISTTVTSDYNGADVSCAGANNGNANTSATGGIGAIAYSWSNGQTGANIVNIGAGTYTVTATDVYGCTSTETVTLSNPSSVGVAVNITSDYNGYNLSCQGGTDGNATASGSGGVGGFNYVWSNGQNTANLTNVGVGTYKVTATDANGCTSVNSVVFQQPPALSISVNSAEPSDCGVNDGIILMTASGGIGTYEYSIDGATWQSSNSFSGLAPGTYFTYVRNTFGTCVKGPTAVTINIPEAPTVDNITVINPTTGVSTDGGILVTASGSGISIEYTIDGTTWQSSNLFNNLSVGTYNVQVRYSGFVCLSSSPVTLVAGGGVVGQGGGENYCSDDLSGVNFVETYYIPFPEDQVLTSLLVLHSATCGFSLQVEEPIQTYVSVGVVEAGTVIYYDHWEDGFETNLSFPIQATTEIWGDGNPSNGMPPGYVTDFLSAADIIVLNNSIVTSTRQSVIDFDAGDKMGSLGNLSVTRLAWASGTNTLLAGALEVYPTIYWGTDFEIPVGENTDVNSMFEYTGVTITASQNNTTVNIDVDGNGSNDVSTVLNEGESYLVNGNVNSGATISASADIQVALITGDICAGAEARFFTVKPTSQWSSDYYNPVATLNNGGSSSSNSNRPTYVHLYNPNNSSISVFWETAAGVQGSVSVSSNGTNFIEIPDNTGSHFYTTDNSSFYALATIDSDPDGSSSLRNSRHDWGFALVPKSQVSSQITLVGFAPGDDPTYTGGSPENSAPVWLTTAYPMGSGSSGSITICIDYNGDGGSLTDGNGVTYDATVVLNNLQNAKIYDPDGDQTGMQVWVCDGSDAIIAGAWGQDPATASGGSPAIDLGVGLPNGIPFATSKCVDLSKDYNSNGLYDECDEVIYSIFIRNSGALPLSTGSLNVKDTLPSDLVYIDGSSVSIINGAVNSLPDDGSGSAFPFDENGLNYSGIIQPGDSIIFRFEAVIGDLAVSKFIRNVAYVDNGQQLLLPEVSFPAQLPTGATLTGIPADSSVVCDAVPIAPTIGSDIYPTNNCEEMDTIPRASWSVQYVNSEETIGEDGAATNIFDGDPNTIWHTQYSGTTPTHPHEVQIDLGATYNIAGFRYLPRQSGINGMIGDFEFYVSSDGVSWGTAVSTGNWSASATEEEEVFPIIRGRYVRLVAISELNGNPWTAVAELNILRCVNYAPVTINYSEASTQTNDGSTTDDCYEITRNWETIDHCGEVATYTQVLTVIDTIAPLLVNVPADVTVTGFTIPETPAINCTTPSNLALGKPTTQSSTDFGGVASRAVDGNTNGIFSNNSITHTNNESQPWWEVDLEAVYSIDEIEIWNRTDCCSSRLSNYYVLVSDFPFVSTNLSSTLLDPNVTSFFQSATAGSPTNISIDTSAQYVRVQLQGTDILSLSEVIIRPLCISGTDNCDSDVQVTFSETNVPAGCAYDITRTWTATDNCGNVSSQSQTISVSTTLDVLANITSDYNGQDLSCSSASDGTGEVVINGGVAPLIINWSDGQTGTSVINLSEGTYYVTVTDDNGCTALGSISLQAPPDITVNTSITSNFGGEDINCFGGSDGSAFVNTLGGTGSFTYLWSNGQTTASATGLNAGTHTVTVTDGNACTSTSTVTLQNPAQLTLIANVTSNYNGEDISCFGASDGSAIVNSSGGTGSVSYYWSNTGNTASISSLSSGTYTVTATDGNGCTAVTSVTLNDPTPITISNSVTDPSLCEANDGIVTISAAGGTGNFEYKQGIAGAWQSGNTFSSLSAGSYDFYVRNDDGSCEVGPTTAVLTDPISQSCPIILTADTLTYCNSDISVSFEVGTSPDATGYTWSVPSGTILVLGQGTDSIIVNMNGIAVGSYNVCVVTNSNCGDSPSCCVTINVISCSEDCSNGIDDDGDGLVDCDDPDCGASANAGSDATICNGENTNLGASGGVSYAWSPSTGLSATNISNPVASPTSTTTYTVTVTDSNGCTNTDAVTITVNALPTANAGSDATICNGENTNLSASGGTSYAWSPSTGLSATNISNPVASPTTTTTYTVTVTDGNGCTATDDLIITIGSCLEDCTNGIDDDLDGDVDCDDSDCEPIANNATLNTCDNSNMTGSGTFFLHDANPTVSSESGVMISYHPTLLDAQNATNILISPYTSADATVYARVERVSTGCFATSEITLNVGAKCAENCNNGIDDDGDGLIDCDDPDCPCCKAYAPTLNGVNKKDP